MISLKHFSVLSFYCGFAMISLQCAWKCQFYIRTNWHFQTHCDEIIEQKQQYKLKKLILFNEIIVKQREKLRKLRFSWISIYGRLGGQSPINGNLWTSQFSMFLLWFFNDFIKTMSVFSVFTFVFQWFHYTILEHVNFLLYKSYIFKYIVMKSLKNHSKN